MFSNSRRTHLFQAQSASVLFSTLSQGPTSSHSSKEYGKRHRDTEREKDGENKNTNNGTDQNCKSRDVPLSLKKTCCLSPKTVEKREVTLDCVLISNSL